jgi:hypothetical protein
MRIRTIVAITLLATTCAVARDDDEIARDGKSAWLIVIGDEATPQDKYAAGELQRYLKEVTGVKLPVLAESKVDDEKDPRPKLLVGFTSLTTQLLLPDTHFNQLGDDGIILKSAGGNIVLYGARRGVVNAVHTFLEDAVGVRWWTSSETTIPKKPTLTIPPLDVRHVPKFRYREVFSFDSTGDGERAVFATRLKLNGHHISIPLEMGGHYTILGFVHTAFNLVPPDKHFAKRPNWFALVDGKRQPGTQLCLTNKAMQAELIDKVMQKVSRNPEAGIISVSQNDCLGPCQCDNCKKVVAEEGSESGPWIRLCNAVAAEVSKQHPDFLVETLAYQYTRKPPKVTKPSKNVLVRLCSIECDFSKPLAGASNKSFGDDLRGWRAIAPNLFIWNYVTNFTNYLIPHPNLATLGDDLRFFADHNVVGVFEQGDIFNENAGDFLPMRTWVLAHLLWDPSRDQENLQREFLAGYYGPAAPHLEKYLKIVNAPAKESAFRVGCYNKDTKFLTDRAIERAAACFDEAERAAANDWSFRYRVRRERLAVDHVALLRFNFKGPLKRGVEPAKLRSEYGAAVDRWVKAAKGFGVKNFNEQQGFDSYVPSLTERGARRMQAAATASASPSADD